MARTASGQRVVCDLGRGDGRIVITAAQKYGCRAIGYELDQDQVDLSRLNVEAAGLKDLVAIELQDIFKTDLEHADVIAVFLLRQQLEKLLRQLKQMRPGSRIISHQFEIPGVPADQTVRQWRKLFGTCLLCDIQIAAALSRRVFRQNPA